VGQQSEIPRICSLHESEQNQLVSCQAIHVAACQSREPCLTVAELDQCCVKPPSLELIANCQEVCRTRHHADSFPGYGFEINNASTGLHQNCRRKLCWKNRRASCGTRKPLRHFS